ncbi:MAG TPA: carboxypeptidase-like regulatory domain-containing protein, partial [Bacteroidales bacterium]|nr:carboxypeptidase-like regulatory domain-containing protein [Bacteroidales bacterium]
MKKLIVPALLVMMPFFGMAQMNLSGKVINQLTREELPGAGIRLLNTYYAAAANNAGTFEIRNIKPGKYNIVTSYVGFSSDTLAIVLDASKAIIIELEPIAIMQDEVIVSATRAGANTPVAHQNLDKKAIATINFGQDLPVLIGNSISAVA